MSNHKPWAIAVVIIAILGFAYLYGTSTSNNQFYQNSVSGSGQQQSSGNIANTNNPNAPPSVCPNGQPSCQVAIALKLSDASDLSSANTDVTNAVTTYYKSADGQKFYPVGASNANTATINYDASYNGVVYAGVAVPAGQSFYVAPVATSDKNLNSRISAYDYKDPVGTGTKVWMFKIDMSNLATPLGGQTVATIPLTVLLYTAGTDSLNSPSDLTSVSGTAGTKSFVRWIDTITSDRANAHYEYEIKINTTDSSLWNSATSTLTIPNLGAVALSSMSAPTSDGTSTFYKYTLSSDLQKANFVVSPKNGDSAQYFTLTLSTNLTANTVNKANLSVTLTIRSFSAVLAGQSVNDLVKVCANSAC